MVVIPAVPTLESTAADNGRRRSLPCAPTSSQTPFRTTFHLGLPPTPLRTRYRSRPPRVYLADSIHSEMMQEMCRNATRIPATLPISTLPNINFLCSCASDSAPTKSLSLPSTPTFSPTLTLDPAEPEIEPPRRSNSTSRLFLKVKAPFRAKNKRFSSPSMLLGESSGS